MGYTGRHRIPPRPVPRQKSAYRFALIGMSALILPALFVSGTELGRHGWDQFVLRDAGTGSTANDPSFLGKKPDPVPGQPAIPSPTPAMPSQIAVLPKNMPTATIVVRVTAGEVLSIAP